MLNYGIQRNGQGPGDETAAEAKSLEAAPGPEARGHSPNLRFRRLMALKDSDWENVAMQARFRPGPLSDILGVSLRHLQRYFAHRSGKTPRQWLRELQRKKARELIMLGYSTKAAAAETMFATSSHF